MKKKVLMSLVLLTMAGVSMVFAQADKLKFANTGSGWSVSAKDKTMTGALTIPRSYTDEKGVAKNVVAIASNGFAGTTITSVVIPDTVTSIGGSAFKSCSRLTSLVIPNSVTSIGSSAFESCSSIKTIDMGDKVTTIGNSAFKNCTNLETLKSANIGISVTTIGSSAFKNCGRLQRVFIQNKVKSIGYSAFDGCSSLNRVNFEVGGAAITIQANAFPLNLAALYKTNGKGVYNISADKKSWIKD